MRPFPTLPALLLAFTGCAAHAASFDCARAQSRVEKMICADATLSKLDEQLGVAYRQVRSSPAGEKADKAAQLAWLKRRNACADAACLTGSYASRIAELQAGRPGAASPAPALAGVWKQVYSCDGVTGIYAERCKADPDVFELAVQVNGARVCATHMATSGAGMRVDEVEDLTPSVTGERKGDGAMLRFRSAWGGSGEARLRLEGNILHWKVIRKDGGESLIPDEATLTRTPARATDRLPACAAS